MTEDQARGMFSTITALGDKALSAIPPALLILVLLNCAFIVSAAWIEIAQNTSRERVLVQIMTSCLERK